MFDCMFTRSMLYEHLNRLSYHMQQLSHQATGSEALSRWKNSYLLSQTEFRIR